MKKNQIFALVLVLLCGLAISACTQSNAMTGGSSWPGMTAEDGIVYTANGTFVEAIQDGKKLWSYPAEANKRLSFFAAPAVDESHVYAGSYDNQLFILNKADGALAASAVIGNNKNKVIASPIVVDGKVYVVSSGGMVSSYTVNVSGETLTPNWQTTLSSEIWVKPVYFDGTLYVASMDKKMHQLDAASGELKESIAIGALMDDMILQDGKLYYSTLSKEVHEMDLTTKAMRTVLTADAEIWASPLFMGDKLIAADMNGVIYCVNMTTGAEEWKTEKLTAEKMGFIASPVALDENTILLIDESGNIMTYDLNGKSISQRSMSQSVYTTPAILESGSFAVVPVSDDGQVKTFTADLKEDWVYTRSTTGSTAEATAEPTVEPTAEPTAAEAK